MGVEYRSALSLVDNPYRGVNLAAFNFSRNFTSFRPNVAKLTAADGGNAFASFLLGYAASGNVQRAGPAELAQRVLRDVRAGRLAAVEPADGEPRRAVGLRSADHRARQPGERRVRCQRRGAGLPGVSGVRPADGTARRTAVRGRRHLFKGLQQLRTARGFTYQLSTKTIVRAGYGLDVSRGGYRPGHRHGIQPHDPYVASLDADRTPANRLANPYPSGILEPARIGRRFVDGARTNINYHIRDREIPEYHQYSVGLQRQLPWRSVLDVSYVGSATRKRPVTRPINDLSREQILLGDAYLNTLVPNPFIGLMPDGGALNTARDHPAPAN